jgi:hypothetical protein
MKPSVNKQLINIGLALAIGTTGAVAQSASTSDTGSFSVDQNFATGWHEATIGSGVFISNIIRTSNRPNCDYAFGYAEAGYMITEPKGDGFFRGSLELAPEIWGAGVYQGPGSYIAGATLLFRYNFVQPGWRVVPYIEAGGGGTFLNIPHSYDGKDFNFNLDGAIGLRYFLTEKCSINAEYRLQHISNADLWDHNVGLNADGPAVGFSVFF